MVIAVQHHKSEDQIPPEFVDLWDDLRSNLAFVQIENAAHWNMASKRMEAQARAGDNSGRNALDGSRHHQHRARVRFDEENKRQRIEHERGEDHWLAADEIR